MENKKLLKFKYILAMIIYGTAGCFTRFISWPSELFVLSRGIVAILVIAVYLFVTKEKINFSSIKKNWLWLLLAGVSLAGNWLCLFASYTYTTIAKAILCNYLAPVIFVLIAPLIFKERRSIVKYVCVFIALLGMIFISGIIDTDGISNRDIVGILLGVGAALFYVGMMIFNKKLKDVAPIDRTATQLVIAIIIMAPFALLKTNFETLALDFKTIIYVLLFGIIHTGIAYILYLGSLGYLDAQTASIFSYIEPVLSVLLSFFVLKENLTIIGWIGGVLIIGSTLASELIPLRYNK